VPAAGLIAAGNGARIAGLERIAAIGAVRSVARATFRAGAAG